MKKARSLSLKISLTITAFVVVLLLCAGAILSMSMKDISDTLIESNKDMGNTSSLMSSSTMGVLTQNRMKELARNKADLVDSMFLDFAQSVRIAASAAEQIYAHAELYPERAVQPPRAENDGVLTVQVLYATGVDPEDEEIKKEVLLLGNVQDALLAINENSKSISSNYISTETGIMIQADSISARKFDDAGNVMPLDAKERPWYQGASAAGAPYFTPVTKDLHTPRMAIMCGVPIYCDGALMGVSGAGMYLDDIEALVHDVDLGENGDACILNQNGQVLFSTNTDGTLAAFGNSEDLRTSENTALASLAARAIQGESGVKRLTIDGVPRYVAFAPMKTVGWSFLIVLSQKEVDAPTKQLRASLNQVTDQAVKKADKHITQSAYMLLVVLAVAGILALLASQILSRRIVKPIQKLTEAVGRIQGDDLDFHWDLDTGGETQLLANSFQSLTQRMKAYIQDIQSITAEKERIGAELNIATQIQASMLPSIFPPFPERSDFDVYATMDPAREVGGDFYDFFLLDDDHLGLVMADVSGKGIPAALFMMASKILVQNFATSGKSPADVLTMVNEQICRNNREEMFVTVWLGILDLKTGKLTASNAGHEYPAIRRAGGSFELFRDKHGFVVGGMPAMRYKNYELQLSPGDELFLYTDGVPEATNAAEELFGTDRMLSALNSAGSNDPKTILDAVKQAVDQYVGEAPQFDDLTMMCLHYQGDDKMKKLTIDAKVENLAQVLSFVVGELEAADCPMKTQMQIEVAVEEIFVNIASYAYAPLTGSAEIGVAIQENPKMATITFVDRGIPYDPLAKEDPDVTLSAEERSIGGLGIYMVKKSMDDVRYSYQDGRNILIIQKIF